MYVDQQLRTMAAHEARRVIVNQLKPVVEPLLRRLQVTWEEALPAIEKLRDLDDLRKIVPDQFFHRLIQLGGQFAIRLVFLKLRPKLKPLLAPLVCTGATGASGTLG